MVVLAGLAAEGATGVAATKRCGGFSIAEGSDETLEPEGQAITAAGIADMRVQAERIGPEIAAYVANLVRTGDGAVVTRSLQKDVGKHITRIAAILRNATGHDFHGYKQNTFLRRIQRRMQVVQIDEVERLYRSPAQRRRQRSQHLFHDLLIGVTQFFRDPREFEALEREVIPKLFEGKGTGRHDPRLGARLRHRRGGLFDRDPAARAHGAARTSRRRCRSSRPTSTGGRSRRRAVGRYPASIAARHAAGAAGALVRQGGQHLRVVKDLREMCIFSPHNLIKRCAVLAARPDLLPQPADLPERRAAEPGHPAVPLRAAARRVPVPRQSENVTRHPKLFAPIDAKHRIFRAAARRRRGCCPTSRSTRARRRTAAAAPACARTAREAAERTVPAAAERDRSSATRRPTSWSTTSSTCCTSRPAPAGSRAAAGRASLDLFNLVHRGPAARPAGGAAQGGRRTAAGRSARTVSAGDQWRPQAVDLIVEPLAHGRRGARRSSWSSSRIGGPARRRGARRSAAAAGERRARPAARGGAAHHPGAAADHDRGAGEHQRGAQVLATRNIQSINEELQSANEELETSKEELQSVNEELQTVNGELAHRVEDSTAPTATSRTCSKARRSRRCSSTTSFKREELHARRRRRSST